MNDCFLLKKCEHDLKNIYYLQAYSVTSKIILRLHANILVQFVVSAFGVQENKSILYIFSVQKNFDKQQNDLVNYYLFEIDVYRNKYNFFVIQSNPN